ncbi:hypothetical protein HZA86_03145 [Candidatus Uhrbacteria bacterium]|nr:hypothetical protein [Candidatus Uhrbacteria bacterium]
MSKEFLSVVPDPEPSVVEEDPTVAEPSSVSSERVESQREAAEMAVMANADMNFALGFERIGDKVRAEESRRKAEFAMKSIEREIKEDGQIFQKVSEVIAEMLRDVDQVFPGDSKGIALSELLRIGLRGRISGEGRDGSKIISLDMTPRAQRRWDRFKEFLGLRRIEPSGSKDTGWFSTQQYWLPQYATSINNLVIRVMPVDMKDSKGSILGLEAVTINDNTWREINHPRVDD